MQPKYRGNGTPERTGSHSFSSTPYRVDVYTYTPLPLPALATTLAEFGAELDRHQVTSVCSDPSL